MKNKSFLVQFEHLKVQEAKLNSLAAWYFSCTTCRRGGGGGGATASEGQVYRCVPHL